jgi:hypothetical protein
LSKDDRILFAYFVREGDGIGVQGLDVAAVLHRCIPPERQRSWVWQPTQ